MTSMTLKYILNQASIGRTTLRPNRHVVGQYRLKSTTTPPTTNEMTTEASSSVPIVTSLAAALFGVTVVSVGAAVVEEMTADSCLPYSSTGQRFDQSTFAGRFSRMFLACDPRLLLYTQDQVREAQAFLLDHQEQQEKGKFQVAFDRELWEARRIVDAAVHPDTGDFIPPPFRMSGYVPFNGPICVAMVASTTTPSLLFWSWVNQSQNALVNYYVSQSEVHLFPSILRTHGHFCVSRLERDVKRVYILQRRTISSPPSVAFFYPNPK